MYDAVQCLAHNHVLVKSIEPLTLSGNILCSQAFARSSRSQRFYMTPKMLDWVTASILLRTEVLSPHTSFNSPGKLVDVWDFDPRRTRLRIPALLVHYNQDAKSSNREV